MEYLTVFRVVLGCAARSRVIVTVSSSASHHETPSGTIENDAKYREIFHFDDTFSRAKKEKPKYNLFRMTLVGSLHRVPVGVPWPVSRRIDWCGISRFNARGTLTYSRKEHTMSRR